MFFQKLSGLETAVLKFNNFQVFHDYTTPECDDRGQVRLSKSDKNIGAGVWRVDNSF